MQTYKLNFSQKLQQKIKDIVKYTKFLQSLLMTTFGISIFPTPEDVIALCIGLFNKRDQSIKYINSLLFRTKNPPLSIIYTAKFLDDQRSIEQYSLDIIRFVSHLSDLSDGLTGNSSMQQSLKNIISQSSFLIEVRHNLTHKNMVEEEIVRMSRSIILNDLQNKFWKPLYDKIIQTYNIQAIIVYEKYEQIYGHSLSNLQKNGLKQKLQQKFRNCMNEEWIISKSSNYEFKQMFPKFLQHFSEQNIQNIIKKLPSHKWALAVNNLLKIFMFDRRNQNILDIVVTCLREKQKQIIKQALILKKLRQIYFTAYLGHSRKFLDLLPESIKQYLINYWKKAESKKAILYNS